jgi:hypothetical protein
VRAQCLPLGALIAWRKSAAGLGFAPSETAAECLLKILFEIAGEEGEVDKSGSGFLKNFPPSELRHGPRKAYELEIGSVREHYERIHRAPARMFTAPKHSETKLRIV